MKRLKKSINKVIAESETIDWLILHRIAKLSKSTINASFSFLDAKEAPSKSFNKSEGYLSLKGNKIVKEFNQYIIHEIDKYPKNIIALSNLFIFITRLSYNGENREILIEAFKEKIGKKKARDIFDELTKSLNLEYFKHLNVKNEFPDNPDAWLELFQGSQYSHQISDPVVTSLQLITFKTDRELDFKYIENMKPIMRSVLFGFYGFNLKITKSKITSLLENEKELAFLAAYIIDDIGSDKSIPSWLNQKLINKCVENHWENIGKHLFINIYGLSYRNKNRWKWNKRIETLLHKPLYNKITKANSNFSEWISMQVFPGNFIALFNWLSIKKVKFNDIEEVNKDAIFTQFIDELKRIIKDIPNTFVSENNYDPFDTCRLNEFKYYNSLAYLLLFTLFTSKKNLKEIRDICYEFKPLFYGGYKAKSLATHFSEIVLIIALSGDKIKGVDIDRFENLKELLSIIEETILIPYIHLSERQEEIWNPECEKEMMTFNSGKILINNAIKKNKISKVKNIYSEFFETFEYIKIAEWPYER